VARGGAICENGEIVGIEPIEWTAAKAMPVR
jgi:hypothetical protein